jgi:hypothetical protein
MILNLGFFWTVSLKEKTKRRAFSRWSMLSIEGISTYYKIFTLLSHL